MNLKNAQKKVKELRLLLDPKAAAKAKKEERKRVMKKGLALGTFFGGLAGIFLAPDSGENTRRKTKEELEKIKENLQTNITEGKEKLGVNFEEGKEKIVELYEDKKEVISQTFSTLKEKIKPHIEPNIVEEEELDIEEEDELAKEEA
ncbi:YtxH domain-containing protein [Clostridium formicaceticum]|uniref:YtxH-like protein n=1 Tax=Clostridium formicaceticum TaxID=1497 RepID=A0AAC9RIL8_9CLOT|nr:YtxH domain-containing protein [Clostridium formicaceticum]AOY76101.1 hypothetical protein BJL90_09430 [Clostridium formicaceticum]ARE86467.1 YtxH-like protein [Clostridium formicaceticum]